MASTERHRIDIVARVAAALVLAAAVSAFAAPDKKPAEKPYALIFGTVWSPDHRPVSGVRVKIRRAGEKKARWQLLSDARGEFAQRVPAGASDYVVWAETRARKGPAAETKVHIENDERLDIGLHLTE